MKEFDNESRFDEPRPLNEAEVEVVSGAETYDFGIMGRLTVWNGCVDYTIDTGPASYTTCGQC